MTSRPDERTAVAALPPLMDVNAFYAAMRAGDTRAMAAYFAQPHAMDAALETETLLLAHERDTPYPLPLSPPTGRSWHDTPAIHVRERLSKLFPGRWFDDVNDREPLSIIRFSPIESVAWLFGADSELCHVLPRTLRQLLPCRLWHAVQHDDCETLDVLLSSTALATCLSDDDRCVILDALSRDLLSLRGTSADAIVNLLLAHGARVDAINLSTFASFDDEQQSECLVQLVAQVVANGAWVVGSDRIFEHCGSGGAWYDSEHAFFSAMVRHGADVRGTAWHAVLKALDGGATDVLLEEGFVDVDSRSGDDQRTPLMVVASSNAQVWDYVSGLVESLLEYGADVEARDTLGRTALMLAARNYPDDDRGPTENDGVAELLAQGGANANARDDAGRTPLHHACEMLRVYYPCDFLLHAVTQLVAHGADVNARDGDEYTPLELMTVKPGVERWSHGWLTTLLRVLVPAGADTSSVDASVLAEL